MKFPIRQDITVLPADEPSIFTIYPRTVLERDFIVITNDNDCYYNDPSKLGFRVKENIGIAVINLRGITKANKNTFIK